MLCCFYSAPTDTSALLSTTSGSSAERRVWGQIKELHNIALFDQWIETPDGSKPSIGRTIDYLKCITFDSTKELEGGKSTGRDLRNGVILIPIANDSTGENALDTVMGTHNKFVLWAVDEMPTMMEGIMRPRSNLSANQHNQFIGIGNANNKSDPHGLACEPINGWSSIDENINREWRGRTLDVLFLHGEESPNDHPDLDHCFIKRKSEYPYPYLSNRISRDEIAEFEGNGDPEEGRQRLGYKRFAIGFWAGDDITQTILTEQFVRKYNAHLQPELWGADGYTVFWGLDPAFTSEGDDNILFPIRVGRDYHGQIQIVFPHDGIKIAPSATNKEDYRMLACQQIKKELDKLGAKPENGCMDAMHDGGLLYKDLATLLNTHSIQALSSIGKSGNPKYGSLVTEYWYGIQEFIQTGLVRGFNLGSNYARELFSRRYYTKSNKIYVETKKEMKKRISRSPDCFIAGTKILTSKGEVNIEDIQVGDVIVTPLGNSHVIQTHKKYSDNIYTVPYKEFSLTGTGDHKIFTWEGWKKLSELSLDSETEHVMLVTLWLTLHSECIKEKRTGFSQLVDTIKTGTRLQLKDFFTEEYGLITSEKFQKVITSTIKMETGETITWKILNVLMDQIIKVCTCCIVWKTQVTLKSLKNIDKELLRKPRNGIGLKKAENGMLNMVKTVGKMFRIRNIRVLIAVKSFKVALQLVQMFAQIIAEQKYILKQNDITKKEFARFAVAILRLINTAKLKTVPLAAPQKLDGEHEVFNLTLLEHNAYYANGVLVRNCGDASVYTCFLINSRLALRSLPYKEQEMRKKYMDYFHAVKKEDSLWGDRSEIQYSETII